VVGERSRDACWLGVECLTAARMRRGTARSAGQGAGAAQESPRATVHMHRPSRRALKECDGAISLREAAVQDAAMRISETAERVCGTCSACAEIYPGHCVADARDRGALHFHAPIELRYEIRRK